MKDFFGFSGNEIEENVINPHGGLERFILVRCPGYKIPKYISDDGVRISLVIEDDNLNEATIAYLESHGVKEVDWKK